MGVAGDISTRNVQKTKCGSGTELRKRLLSHAVSSAIACGFFAVAHDVTAQAIDLAGAEDVAILGASTVTNTGPTVVAGHIALTPGSSITGFPPGVITRGGIHINDVVATQARTGALAAYTLLRNETFTSNLSGIDLGGLTLTSGVYRFNSSAQLTGTLRLDTQGDPGSAFHFQIGTSLTVSSSSSVITLNGDSDNVFWQVGSSATLGSGSSFYGTIIADQSIDLNAGASLNGRALALNGAVTLNNNAITAPTPTPTPNPTPGPTPTPTPTPNPTPGPTPNPTPGPTPNPTPGSTPTPTPGPTPGPTATPSPTPGPSPTPTPEPSPTPAPLATSGTGRILTQNEITIAHALDRLAALQPDSKLIERLSTLPRWAILDAINLLSPEELSTIFIMDLSNSEIQNDNIQQRLWTVRQGRTGFDDSSFAVQDTQSSRSDDGKQFRTFDDNKNVLPVEGKNVVSPRTSVPDKRWGFFISGSGEVVDIDSTSAARGSSFDTGGVTVGADYRIDEHFVVGAAIGYANTSADLSLGGSLESNSAKISVYSTYYNSGFYVEGILGAGYGSVETRRLTAGGYARGDTEATNYSALLGTGYDFRIGNWSFGPLASLTYSRVGIDDFVEEGAIGALYINSQDRDSLKSALGVQTSYSARIGSVTVTPFARAKWEHELLDSTSSIEAGFTPDDYFTVDGPEIGTDSVVVDLGVSVQLTPAVGIFTYYTGEFGRENYNVQSVTIGMGVRF